MNMLLCGDAILDKGAVGARRSAEQAVKNKNGNAQTNGEPNIDRS